jgi:hypothetical protein
MGGGHPPHSHFSLPAKYVNRWVPPELVVEIAAGRACAPGGPYLLQPIDTGELGARHAVGIRMNTTFLRDVWIEHRTVVLAGSAAQVMTTQVMPWDYYGMGASMRRVVADMLQNTTEKATDLSHPRFLPPSLFFSSSFPLSMRRVIADMLQDTTEKAAALSHPRFLPPSLFSSSSFPS